MLGLLFQLALYCVGGMMWFFVMFSNEMLTVYRFCLEWWYLDDIYFCGKKYLLLSTRIRRRERDSNSVEILEETHKRWNNNLQSWFIYNSHNYTAIWLEWAERDAIQIWDKFWIQIFYLYYPFLKLFALIWITGSVGLHWYRLFWINSFV